MTVGPAGTPNRAELDRQLALDPAVGSEPRGDIYGRIGVHPDRFKLRSLPMEARVLAKSLFGQGQPKPFVIYGRPRSGTTVLVRLLDQVPQVQCDGELLHFFLLNPVGFLSRLPKRVQPDVAAYGVKLISFHLTEIQRIRRPLAFFDKLAARDYAVLHLTRNTWDQTLSLAKAHKSSYYKNRPGGKPAQTLRLEPARFLELLRWNDAMLAYENRVMAHVPHLPVTFENDLSSAELHQPAIDRICTYLGTTSAPVKAKSPRTGGKDGLLAVENLDEVAAYVQQSDLAHLLPAKLENSAGPSQTQVEQAQ